MKKQSRAVAMIQGSDAPMQLMKREAAQKAKEEEQIVWVQAEGGSRRAKIVGEVLDSGAEVEFIDGGGRQMVGLGQISADPPNSGKSREQTVATTDSNSTQPSDESQLSPGARDFLKEFLTANRSDWTKKFRSLTIRVHPDKSGGSKARFLDLQSAYDFARFGNAKKATQLPMIEYPQLPPKPDFSLRRANQREARRMRRRRIQYGNQLAAEAGPKAKQEAQKFAPTMSLESFQGLESAIADKAEMGPMSHTEPEGSMGQEVKAKKARQNYGNELLKNSGADAVQDAQARAPAPLGNEQREKLEFLMADKAELGPSNVDEEDGEVGSHLKGRFKIQRYRPDVDHVQSASDVIRESREEAEAEAATRRAGMEAAFSQAVKTALKQGPPPQWDKTQLVVLQDAAKAAVKAITKQPLRNVEEVEMRVEAAQLAIQQMIERVDEDYEWILSLAPYTEESIEDGVKKAESDNDKTVMNNGMCQDWRSFKNLSKVAGERDHAAIKVKLDSLASEISRKTPVDEDLEKSRITNVSNPKKNTLFAALKAKCTRLLTVRLILDRETDGDKLNKIVTPLATLDSLPYLLEKTPDRAQLRRLAQKGATSGKLRRAFLHFKEDPAKVEYFLTGEGGQNISDLEQLIKSGGKVWSGGTCGAPTYLPAGTARATIEATAIPKQGSSCPPAGGYAGNRTYGNKGKPPDMLLPRRDHSNSGAAINYTEFDIKPYTPGVNRGPKRFVRGSDGHYYYTNDHYQSFKRFV